VVGEKGTVIWDGSSAPYKEIGIPGEEGALQYKHERTVTELVRTGKERQDGCLDEMFSALVQGRKPAAVCTDNIKSVAMAYGPVQSAKEGRKISLR
jgi:predicted dehydrogenase